MLYMLEMTVNIPPGKDEERFEALKAEEKAYVQRLQRDGKWKHIWRVAGRFANVSILDVTSHDELHDIVTKMPLFSYIDIKVTPLSKHPASIV
jgi:muconolactone D-isomerase